MKKKEGEARRSPLRRNEAMSLLELLLLTLLTLVSFVRPPGGARKAGKARKRRGGVGRGRRPMKRRRCRCLFVKSSGTRGEML
jgi:hypothetical protein